MARQQKPAEGKGLVTFIPGVAFTGYPDGKSKVAFRPDVASTPVPEAYPTLMREKGLVKAGTQFIPIDPD